MISHIENLHLKTVQIRQIRLSSVHKFQNIFGKKTKVNKKTDYLPFLAQIKLT